MGKFRFLYDNLITDESMITVSSLRPGYLTSALKEGLGSAGLNPSGQFTGSVDLEYTVEIDSISGGNEVGQATFRWSDGGGSWNSTGVTTSAAPTLLNNGVYIAFAAGAGDDFEAGDTWYMKGLNRFSAGKTLDLDRDSRYRSSAIETPNTITIDLGSPQTIQALSLFDHNFSATATITLKGNTSDSWGSPAFSEAVSYNAVKILHYLSTQQTYRYWRIEITDESNPDSYIEIGELFLGAYLELSKNFSWEFNKNLKTIVKSNKTQFGVKRTRYYNTGLEFLAALNYIADADVASLETMLTAITDKGARTIKPVFFNDDSDTPAQVWLMEFREIPRMVPFQGRNQCELNLVEVLRSVA